MNVPSIVKTWGISVLALLCAADGIAQQNQSGTSTTLNGVYVPNNVNGAPDGLYSRETNIKKGKIPYPSIREADVMYTTRIWQMIDLREKMNHQFYYPIDPIESPIWGQKNLWDVIYQLAVEGGLPIYSPVSPDDRPNDTFQYEMTKEQINAAFYTEEYSTKQSREMTEKEDLEFQRWGEMPTDIIMIPDTTLERIPGTEIIGYKIKEDWIWDKQRGQRYTRILGIAPMIYKKVGNQKSSKPQELFWIYYPTWREALNTFDSFNPFNNAANRSYAEIFEYRYFSSYVIKEKNVYNREINDYAKGLDAIAESERIKEDLFILEHDLWHY